MTAPDGRKARVTPYVREFFESKTASMRRQIPLNYCKNDSNAAPEYVGAVFTVRLVCAKYTVTDPADFKRQCTESTCSGQVGAPMPGLIVGVAVAAGQRVERGERLFTIEAMKMETAVYAETTATVREVAVEAGHRVEAHDLIVVLDPDG